MEKKDIEHPEPGSLPPRISFIEQMGGSAGYYVRFKDIPEEEGGPIRKYVPILQFDSQEEALQAAIEYRDRTAEELGLPTQPERSPHAEEAKEKMSDSHNRTGLRGLGLTFNTSRGTVYPILSALWSGAGGQKQVSRGMASRGLHSAMEELAPYLKEHLHPERDEEGLVRHGAEGVARLLVQIARSAGPGSRKRDRIESLLRRWAERHPEDRALLKRLADEKQPESSDVLGELAPSDQPGTGNS